MNKLPRAGGWIRPWSALCYLLYPWDWCWHLQSIVLQSVEAFLSLQLSWKCCTMISVSANLPLELLSFEMHMFSHLTWIPESWCDATILVSPSPLQITCTFLSFNILFRKCITWEIDVKPERHKPKLQISYLDGNVLTNSVFLPAHMHGSAIFKPFLEFCALTKENMIAFGLELWEIIWHRKQQLHPAQVPLSLLKVPLTLS